MKFRSQLLFFFQYAFSRSQFSVLYQNKNDNETFIIFISMAQNSSVSSSSHSRHIPQDCRCDYSYLRKKGPKFEGETTTQAHYKPHPIQKQPVFEAPKPKTKHYDPQSLQTSYKAQYIKPTITRDPADNIMPSSNSMIQSYQANKAKAPFYSETEYKKSFQPKQIKIQKQPAYQYKPKDTKFQGESSYKQQYTAKKNQDLISAGQQIISAQKMYEQKPKPKFEGQSSYKSTFQKHDVKVERQPEYKYQPKNTRFEGESSYKATYTKLPDSAYKSQLQHCPVHPDKVALR